MCGRVELPRDIREILRLLKIAHDRSGLWPRRHNVPPTTPVPVAISQAGERSLELMRWGLVPAWARDLKIGFSSFNARADSLTEKPAFRDAWRAGRRCLVVTAAFYEWRKTDKQPFAVALGNGGPMLMAGLWEEWRPRGGEALRSCTIITTEANAAMREIHDRMPVILDQEDWAGWLGEAPLPEPMALLKPYPAERMSLWPVDKRVGNVKNEGAELIEKIAV
jgi:putative SOS response-associated peptidase YedK